MFEDMMVMYERGKQEISNIWDSIDSVKMAAQASDAIKTAAGTPENANMVKAIEESRSRNAPVQLEAGIFQDTTADTIVDDLEAEGLEPVVEEAEVNAFDMDSFKAELKEDEGVRTDVYEDTTGNLTVGVGHKVLPDDNLKAGSSIDDDNVDRLLDEDANAAVSQAMELGVDWDNLPSPAKHVLANMTFQLGKTGVSKFKKTLDLVKAGDYQGASVEMMDSKWAKQTPNRAKKMSALMASSSN